MASKTFLTEFNELYKDITSIEKITGCIGHSDRVAHSSFELAKAYNIGGSSLKDILMGGCLHDAGKLSIKQNILESCDVFGNGDPRRKEIEKHPAYGVEILKAYDFCTEIMKDITLHHHERYDGTGYPEGLAGEEISIYSRIVGAADTLDAIVTKRLYKKKHSLGEAFKKMVDESGAQFDPDVLKTLFEMIYLKHLPGHNALWRIYDGHFTQRTDEVKVNWR